MPHHATTTKTATPFLPITSLVQAGSPTHQTTNKGKKKCNNPRILLSPFDASHFTVFSQIVCFVSRSAGLSQPCNRYHCCLPTTTSVDHPSPSTTTHTKQTFSTYFYKHHNNQKKVKSSIRFDFQTVVHR